MFTRISIVVCATTLLLACGRTPTATPKQLVGDDERSEGLDAASTAVGPFGTDALTYCTTFAIDSHRIVTAAHCVDPAQDATIYRYRFGGVLRRVAALIELDVKSDVAILATEDAVAAPFALASADGLSAAAAKFEIPAFDLPSLKMRTARHGKVERDPSAAGAGLLVHDLDTLPGASGAPILVDGRVVGVHLGALGGGGRNLGVELQRRGDADVRAAHPEWRPESPVVVTVVKDMIASCMKSEACREAAKEIVGHLVLRVVEFAKSLIDDIFGKAEDEPAARELKKNLMTAAAKGATAQGTIGQWEVREFEGHAGIWAGESEISTSNIALTAAPQYSSADLASATVGAFVELSFRSLVGRPATDDELRTAGALIRGGATLGQVKKDLMGVGAFEKHGNNGTVSCKSFCAGPQWGRAGSCVVGRRTSDGLTFGCDAVPGLVPNGAELTCQCVEDGFEKLGNNGAVSCGHFCIGPEWGTVGACLGGTDAATAANVGCHNGLGTIGELKCFCAQ